MTRLRSKNGNVHLVWCNASVIKWIYAYLITICVCFCNQALSQNRTDNDGTQKLIYPDLVNKFYDLDQQQIFWFTSPASSSGIRSYFIEMVDSSVNSGLNRDKYHLSEIRNNTPPKDSAELMKLDRIFTDAIIAYCKDLYQGADINKWIMNDEISPKYAIADDDYLLDKVIHATSVSGLKGMLESIEPKEKEYLLLKNELKRQLIANNGHHIDQLDVSLNLYRWIHHFHFDKFIVVNIPSTTLWYYEGDDIKLQMKVVVGKPTTRSPRFFHLVLPGCFISLLERAGGYCH